MDSQDESALHQKGKGCHNHDIQDLVLWWCKVIVMDRNNAGIQSMKPASHMSSNFQVS